MPLSGAVRRHGVLWGAVRTTKEDAVEEKTAEREYPHRVQRHVPRDRREHPLPEAMVPLPRHEEQRQ